MLLSLLKPHSTAAAPPPAGQSITDNFTGSNGTSLAGKTTTSGAKVWQVNPGSTFALDGSGLASNTVQAGDDRAWVDADLSTNLHHAQIDLSVAGSTGLFCRAKDKDHYWIFYNNNGQLGVAYQVGIGFQYQRQANEISATLPMTLHATFCGAHYNTWYNASRLLFVEDMATDGSNPMYTTYPNGTLAGPFAETTTGKFDNFQVDNGRSINQIFFVGDSLTSGFNLGQQYGSNVFGFAWQTMNSLGPGYFYHNYSADGARMDYMYANFVTPVNALYNTNFAKNIVVVEGGINDLLSGVDVATVIEPRMQTLCNAYKSAGFKVVVCTVTPFLANEYETSRQTFNTWIRANYASFAHAVADFGASGNGIGSVNDQNNATNYQTDKTHWTVAGAAIAAAIVKTAILALP